ncbi:MAG: hypothetical protein ACRDU8_01665, partial [Egibacteraceae bacterium]
GELLDEELLLCSDDPDRVAHPHWTPHLWRLSPQLRDVAETTVTRLDVAHGLLERVGEGPDDIEWSPALSVVADAFTAASAQVAWRYGLRDEPPLSGAALLLPDRVVLHDDIDDEAGQHLLVFRSAAREVAHLVAKLDPQDRARVGGEPAVATHPAHLIPAPDALATAAATTSTVGRGPVWRDAPERLLHTYGTDEGLWLLESRGGPEPVATLRLLDDGDLVVLARTLLEPAATSCSAS